MFYILMTDIT